MDHEDSRTGLAVFLEHRHATFLVLSGDAHGAEYTLDQSCVRIGRGPGVDLALDGEGLSREHVILEFQDGAYRLRASDAASPVLVNGASTRVAELKPGDRVELGDQTLQYAVEKRRRPGSPRRQP